jgi:hypothetical protein
MAQQPYMGPGLLLLPLSEVTKSSAFVAVGDWPTGRATILSILMCPPEPIKIIKIQKMRKLTIIKSQHCKFNLFFFNEMFHAEDFSCSHFYDFNIFNILIPIFCFTHFNTGDIIPK